MNTQSSRFKDSGWIDWTQLIIVIMLFPFFFSPAEKYVFVTAILPFLFISRWLAGKQVIERTILDWGIFLLMTQILLNFIVIPDLKISLSKITNLLFGIALFYSLVVVLRSRKIIKLSIFGFLGLGFLFAAFCISGMKFMGDPLIKTIPVISKLFAEISENTPLIKWNLHGAEKGFNANAVGGIIILFIPLYFGTLISIFDKKKRKSKILVSKPFQLSVILALCLIIVLAILTLSFLSWLGLITGVWTLLFILQKNKRGKMLLILTLIIIIFLNLYLLDTDAAKRKIEIRKVRWVVGTHVVKENPLTGIGLNQFRHIPSIGYKRSHAFNHLLHTAVELGIPGLIAFLTILIGAGFMCIKVWHKSNTEWVRIAAIGLGCGQLAHFIFGLGDSIPLGAKPGFIFWISLALIGSLYNYTIKSSQSQIEKNQ